jgi:hypothetical protein
MAYPQVKPDRLLRARPVYEDVVSSDPAGGAPAGTEPTRDWPGIFEDILGAPVVLRSYGPTAAAKRGLQAAPVLPGRDGLCRDGGSSMSRLMASAMAW